MKLRIFVLLSLHCTKNDVFRYGFLSKCDQIRRELRIWSRLLDKSVMENFINCSVLGALLYF